MGRGGRTKATAEQTHETVLPHSARVLSADELQTELAKLKDMADYRLVSHTSNLIHREAVWPTPEGNARIDLAYREASLRGNTGLYQRAFNDVAEGTGHSALAQSVDQPTPSVGEVQSKAC
jgi:hypothetical protein